MFQVARGIHSGAVMTGADGVQFILVTGGYYDSGSGWLSTAVTEVYNFATDTWSLNPGWDLPIACRGIALHQVSNKELLLFGGWW